ncbi:MAG: glucose-6-phosphate isomerase family protein [bacterium]
MITTRTLEQLKPALKNPASSGPGEVYFVLRPEVGREFGKEPNITIVPPGRLGDEFPKTFGHYHTHNEPEIYRFLYGSGIVLIQQRDEKGVVKSVRAINASGGQTVKVPGGFGHCLINTGDDLLITADWESDEAGHSYTDIKARRGMAYYVLEKEGNIVFEKNIHYKEVPEIELISTETLNL